MLEKPLLDRPVPSGLRKAATSGMVWLFAQSVVARAVGFVSQLFLAWLLTPADFGTIGLAYTISGIAQTVVSFGVDDVLLQRQKTVRMWSSPAFWISLSLGLIGMLGMLVAAPIASHYYRNADLIGIISVLAIGLPISTLSTIPAVTIRLAMNFSFLAGFNIFEVTATQIGTILFAWMGFGAYSFAIPIPTIAVIRAIMFWRKSRPPVLRRFKAVQLWYLLSRSTTVFATRICIEIVSQGDYIVLGLIASKSTVGLYFFAFRFSAQPVRMLAGNFVNVLLPAFAQLRSEPIRQTDAALRTCRLLAYLVMPFCFLQAALAEPGLRLLFGNRWQGSVPLVELLSIGLPFDAVSWITGTLLSARREFGRALRFHVIAMPVFFGSVVAGAYLDGVVGVATGVVIYYMTYPPFLSILVLRSGGVAVRTVLELYVVPTLLAGGAIGVGYLVMTRPELGASNLLQVIGMSVASGLLYPLSLYLFRPDIFTQIITRLDGLLSRIRRTKALSSSSV